MGAELCPPRTGPLLGDGTTEGGTGTKGRERRGLRARVPSALTLAVPLVDEQLVALLAAALEAAHRVPADVVATPVVEPALVDVWWGQDGDTPRTPGW